MTSEEAGASILQRLSMIPGDADVSLVMRHAEREEVPADSYGADARLTSGGIASAERLGSLLSLREPGRLRASPLPRCIHTAEAIRKGAGWDLETSPDQLLGDPGPFVIDPVASGPLFLDVGAMEVVRRQLSGAAPPAGMRPTPEGVALLLDLVGADLGEGGLLDIYVTHDSILAVLVGTMFRLGVDESSWPRYLDGLILWRSQGRLNFSWRGIYQASHPVRG